MVYAHKHYKLTSNNRKKSLVSIQIDNSQHTTSISWPLLVEAPVQHVRRPDPTLASLPLAYRLDLAAAVPLHPLPHLSAWSAIGRRLADALPARHLRELDAPRQHGP